MTPEERRERLYRAMDNDRRSGYGSRSRYEGERGGRGGRGGRGERGGRGPGSGHRPQRHGPGRNNSHSGLKLLVALLIAAILLVGGYFLLKPVIENRLLGTGQPVNTETFTETEAATTVPETESLEDQAEAMLEIPRLLAAQYDYDGAVEYVNANQDFADTEAVRKFLSEVETVRSTLVQQDITQITHIFFHSLIVDKSNALDEERWGKQARGYNTAMTTIPEFEKILQSMYDKGFVLVSLHDMAYMEKQEDGSEKMVSGKIMLPPGKKAFVMSQDDVNYYEYMEGAGFADRVVLDADGKPTMHYTDRDGNESTGEYDIVPILDRFIEEHPDFSYHGHKACLVFTGYNGVLGYRTDESYLPENYEEHKVEGGHDVEAERKEAVKVMKALVEDGYDLGSHSWGHRDMGAMSADYLKVDMDKWDKNVNSLIKEATGKDADILIYPFGADIGDWRGYTSDSQSKEGCKEKFDYLYKQGFRYFCNVDSSRAWVQKGDNYLRTGRRALAGYDMYLDITQGLGRFTDLWDNTSDIFDRDRPTPVDSY